ncbi:MAG: ATP-binding protein [Nevskiaceae bacterium]|nr:MAG: ATP-binding protein [Nevskiaceae bacterium]TBR71578.1 MAG: ATP-binding protein [Nevskiaceae bacterium]
MFPADASTAYRWRTGALQAIHPVQAVALDDLLGIDRQKAELVRNTAQFVAHRPANHALLTGSRGTGKSSLVKAVLTRFAADGLRLIEVPVHELFALPDVVAPLRGRTERFILYVDDFSVAADDPALASLKAALDGGVEEPPDNVLIYATSNRRHLLPEFQNENEQYTWHGDELHPGESVEEKISLSERFGLWLSFPPFTQDQYLNVVQLHLRRLNCARWDDETRVLACRWALQRGSRSGRVANQFARDFAGQQPHST